MDIESKERIASRFFRFPVLCMIVRTLLYSFWFRMGVIGFIMLPVVLGAVLAKIWRTTPEGFRPVVRVSGLDWLQAKALQRTAVNELKIGQVREGIISYSVAVGNNPGDVRLVRGFLRAVSEFVEAPEFQGPALARAFWLLRLTETNMLDLEIAASIFEKYGLTELLLGRLASRERELPSGLQKTYLRVMFNEGRMAEFGRFWRSLNPSAELFEDEELRLYRMAFDAGRDSSAGANLARQRLRERLQDQRSRKLATQLCLTVCERRLDADEYLAHLEALCEWGEDRLIDHVRAWRLLASVGRRSEAVNRARAFSNIPTTGLETLQLVQALFSLGLRDPAVKLLDKFSPEFSYVDALWVLYANLLIESQQWSKLHQLALVIRLNNDVREHLHDLSWYMEGRAELGLNRLGAATEAFEKLGLMPEASPELAVAIARSLHEIGLDRSARTLLASAERKNGESSAYWELAAGVAFSFKDSNLLLRAAVQNAALNPDSWIARNNLAAALVTNRRDLQQAIQLTFRLFTEFPGVPAVRINHALALAQNYRYDEADRVLAVIRPKDLTESERAVYQLACLETLVGQRRFDLARSFLNEIDPEHLFPCQRDRLQELTKDIADGAGRPRIELTLE